MGALTRTAFRIHSLFNVDVSVGIVYIVSGASRRCRVSHSCDWSIEGRHSREQSLVGGIVIHKIDSRSNRGGKEGGGISSAIIIISGGGVPVVNINSIIIIIIIIIIVVIIVIIVIIIIVVIMIIVIIVIIIDSLSSS